MVLSFTIHVSFSHHVYLIFTLFSIFLAFIMSHAPFPTNAELSIQRDLLKPQHPEHRPPIVSNFLSSYPSTMSNSSVVNIPLSSLVTYPADFGAPPPYVPKMPRFITREERLEFEQYKASFISK